MQKNEFEVMVKELLPDVTAQAMEKWTQYAQELEQDGTEKECDLYDAAYVELRLVKEHQGEPTAAARCGSEAHRGLDAGADPRLYH